MITLPYSLDFANILRVYYPVSHAVYLILNT